MKNKDFFKNQKHIQPIYPIFIVGESRSGKTLLGNLLAIHPETCWFTNYSNFFPRLSILSGAIRLRDFPYIGPLIQKQIITDKGYWFVPRPDEGDKIYHKFCKFEHARWTTEEDLNQQQIQSFYKIIIDHMRFSGKKRFINDQSANIQRIKQIAVMFPQAYFIHILRDGRAVANEMIREKWWSKNILWWYKGNPDTWRKDGKEPVLLCGLDWKYSIKAIHDSLHLFRERYLEIKYEALVDHPIKTMKKVIDFCKLPWTDSYAKMIPSSIPNNNYRWKQELTDHQISLLNKELGNILRLLHY